MSFYQHQYPPMYAVHPMYPNQDVYAMYPNSVDSAPVWYEGAYPATQLPYHGRHPYHHHHHHHHASSPPHVFHKPGFNNRKISADSGISEISSRKTSNISTISNGSLLDEAVKEEEPVKEEPPFEELDEEMSKQIVEQVESYFSDASITKDKFLLKHVKRNKEGFVSLKLISSFKRVKHLTKDWRQVAHAVEHHSEKLEVNDLKTKVRRLEPLPEYDETTPSRTVVALNLPLERPTIEAVAEIFAKCGEIVLVRILRPGNPIPADIKPFANKHPEMTAKVCALIEFECTDFAHKAVKELNEEEEDKMKVMELTAPPPKTTKKEQKKTVQPQQRRFSHAGFSLPHHHQQPEEAVHPRRKISLFHNMKFSTISEKPEDQQQSFALNPNAPTFQMHRISTSRPPMPFLGHPQMHPHHPGMDLHAMPYMIRRMSLVHPHPHHPSELPMMGPVVGSRQPQQPPRQDKSKGFQKWCKSRMESTAAKKPGSRAVPIVAPPQDDDQEEAVGGAVAANQGEERNNSTDSGHEDGSEVDMTESERTR